MRHDAAERDLPYSIGAQPWYPIAAREAAVMAEGAALLDLSPFAKFDIEGPDAFGVLLNQIAAAQWTWPIGRAIYTPLLNDKGGIEADVTVTRTGSDAFA